MFVSYILPCHSGKQTGGQTSIVSSRKEHTDLEKTKSEFFITLCNSKFCSKALKFCFLSEFCLHFCALY